MNTWAVSGRDLNTWAVSGRDMITWAFILQAAFLSSTVYGVSSAVPSKIWCYNCVDFPNMVYSLQSTCQRATTLLNNRRTFDNKTVVEQANFTGEGVETCTSNVPFCVVEEITDLNTSHTTHYRRRCSSGQDLTPGPPFPLETQGYSATFGTQVQANNATLCAHSRTPTGSPVNYCVTLCSHAFCNGPSPQSQTTPTSGNGQQPTSATLTGTGVSSVVANKTWCYSCSDYPSMPAALQSTCQNATHLLSNRHTFDSKSVLAKATYVGDGVETCQSSSPFCVTEEIKVNSNTTHYRRRCSNGRDFDPSPPFPTETFRYSTPISPGYLASQLSKTVCPFSSDPSASPQSIVIYCITLCTGPFCNGPPDDPSLTSDSGQPSTTPTTTGVSSSVVPSQTWCYSCVDYPGSWLQSACQRATNLLNNRRAFDHKTVVEQANFRGEGVETCSSYTPFCVVEEIIDQNTSHTTHYRRRCSSGQDLTPGLPFPLETQGYSATFSTQVQANSATLCAHSRTPTGSPVNYCVTLCSHAFCNGPSPQSQTTPASGNGTTNSPARLDDYWCYSCTDVGRDQSSCRTASTYLDTQRALDHRDVVQRQLWGVPGAQNCRSWADHCVILDIYDTSNSGHTQYTRSCSDGRVFDVTFQDGQHLVLNATGTRLETDPSGNHTVHLIDSRLIQASVTLCQGDFCNGPLLRIRADKSVSAAGCSVLLGRPASLYAVVMVMLTRMVGRI